MEHYDEDGITFEFQEILAQVPFIDNGFDVVLPPPTILHLLIEDFPTHFISDNVARWTFAGFDAHNSAGNRIGEFYYADFNRNEPPNVRNDENEAFWFYADRSVTMRGEVEVREYDEWYDIEYIDIINFNVDLQRGWNVVYRRTTRTTIGNVITQTTTFTHQRPADVNLSWRFRANDVAFPIDPDTRSATSVERQSLFLRR